MVSISTENNQSNDEETFLVSEGNEENQKDLQDNCGFPADMDNSSHGFDLVSTCSSVTNKVDN